MRNPLAAAFTKYAMEAKVTEAELVTPAMRRIRLETGVPIAFPYRPGQHIRVQINDPLSVSGILRPADTLRTYTIWDLAPDRRALELRAHLYESGTGAQLAAYVDQGQAVLGARQAGPALEIRLWTPFTAIRLRACLHERLPSCWDFRTTLDC
ncbi:hypothetical protein [Nonomuraea basaltis]|uniref:hypothetical protein n=1 Tax=Nonomuraea basaltis TaxID=2495887 RepID=UPI00197F5590|nr:hypothetical protein [Nonomuraea basaltis]